VAAGKPHAAIANLLHSGVNLLRRHFADELAHGGDRVTLAQLENLQSAAKAGSAPAANRLRDVAERTQRKAEKAAAAETKRQPRSFPFSKLMEEKIHACFGHQGTQWDGIISDPTPDEFRRSGMRIEWVKMLGYAYPR
jgi:hypothetical protein